MDFRAPLHAPAAVLPLVLAMLLFATAAPAREDESVLRAKLRDQVAAGDYRAALATADAALSREPDSAVALQYRAYALHRLARPAEALRAYERALVLEPENWWAWLNMGELLATEGRADEALAAIGRAVVLNPSSRDLRERLTRVHREAGDYEGAVAAVRRALVAGVEPAWCHAELGYLWWVLGNGAAARDEWVAAREAGGDAEACEHGLRLVRWDRPAGTLREREELARRRQGVGPEWVFTVGEMEFHTRVGPSLPRELERLLLGLQEDFARALEVEEDWAGSIRVWLSRTMEQHEEHRRRLFPQGYSGRAFFVRSAAGRRGRPTNLDLYVAWSAPGIERGLSHELAHALLRQSTPRTRNLPPWLDEGIATYLELSRTPRGSLASGTVRTDLLEALAEARAGGAALGLRELLVAPGDDFVGPRARARYAQAWSTVHFLLHGHSRGGARRLREYLSRVEEAAMAPPEAVFREVYGDDLDVIEAAWLDHVEGLRAD